MKHLETVKIEVKLTRVQLDLLDQLAETGLYGRSAEEAAERVLSEGLVNRLKDGEVKLTLHSDASLRRSR